ncbi:MAG: hypothetical protein HY052_08780 [Proteobacteria bacterium]|nr:hypothetical protein [Pseudomonadota bacterium]
MKQVIDKREQMANQFLMRGYASVKEILTASFGEWPPKGLEINSAILHDQQVILESDPFMPNRGSMIRSKVRRMRVNPDFCEDMIHSTMGHEAIHILQDDHSHRIAEIFGLEAATAVYKTTTGGTSTALMTELTGDPSNIQKFSLRLFFNAAAFMQTPTAYLAYMREGIEVQARLHSSSLIVMSVAHVQKTILSQDFIFLSSSFVFAGHSNTDASPSNVPIKSFTIRMTTGLLLRI